MRDSATDAQIIAAIARHCSEHGYGPSIIEVAQAIGYTSVGSVSYRLRKLRDEGKITWQPGRARTLRVAREVTA